MTETMNTRVVHNGVGSQPVVRHRYEDEDTNAVVREQFATPALLDGSGHPDTWVARVFDEALIENDHIDALAMHLDWHSTDAARRFFGEALEGIDDALNELGHEGLASLVHTPPSGNLVITPEVDTEAAQAQAEALGASDAQRAKLRAIIQARVDAERKVAELTRELDAPITADDKRVWPIFAEVAKAAQANSYCSEYDRMSVEAGIPDRDELRGAGFIIDPSDWYANVSIRVERTETVRVFLGRFANEEDATEAANQIGIWSVNNAAAEQEVVDFDRESFNGFEVEDVEEADED